MKYKDDDQPVYYNGHRPPRFKWVKMKECLFVLTFHPVCQDERRFDTKVAKRIVEIYREHFA